MVEVAWPLYNAFTSLLSAAVRLAEVGQDEEAGRLLESAKKIQNAEAKMRTHTKDARVGKIVKFDLH